MAKKKYRRGRPLTFGEFKQRVAAGTPMWVRYQEEGEDTPRYDEPTECYPDGTGGYQCEHGGVLCSRDLPNTDADFAQSYLCGQGLAEVFEAVVAGS